MNRSHVPTRRTGFTLLELIMVLVMLAITLGMVAPALRGFGDNRRAQDTATDMLLLIRWARAAAIAEARPYRFNFDPDTTAYYLTAQVGGSYEPVASDYGRRFDVPVGITVAWVEPRHAGEVDYLSIDATGAVEAGRVVVMSGDDIAYELSSASAAESYRITPPAEVQP